MTGVREVVERSRPEPGSRRPDRWSFTALAAELVAGLGAEAGAIVGVEAAGWAPVVLAAVDAEEEAGVGAGGDRSGSGPDRAGGERGAGPAPQPDAVAVAVAAARRAWREAATAVGPAPKGGPDDPRAGAPAGERQPVAVEGAGSPAASARATVVAVVRDGGEPVAALAVVGPAAVSPEAAEAAFQRAETAVRDRMARYRLEQAERRHRLGLEHVRRHLSLLVRAGDALASASFALDEPLRALASVVVPLFADWFAVDVDGRQVPVPAGVEVVGGRWRISSTGAGPSDHHGHPDGDLLVDAVFGSGRSEMVVRRPASGGDHLPGPELGAGRPAGLAESAMVVPVWVRGAVVAAASFVTWSGRRGYRLSDLRVAEGLAERVAVTIERSLLWRDQQRAAELAERSRRRLQAVVDASPVGIVELDRSARPRWWNAAAVTVLDLAPPAQPTSAEGAGSGQPRGGWQPPAWVTELFADVARRAPLAGEVRAVTDRLGQTRHVACSATPLGGDADDDGDAHGLLVLVEDVSERQRMAESLRQSERLEATARLASTVAHDFNNLLTVVLGSAELLLAGLDPEDPLADEALAVRDAGERAADLTSQLLSIGHRRALQPVLVDPDQAVGEMSGLIRRVLGPDVVFEHRASAEPRLVLAEPSELERIVVNLARNARDAMPDGGRLVVEVATRRQGQFEEPVVEIAVTDTGVGMAPEVAARCLEPFFTTKPKGQGTGLGLAGVHASVGQMGGTVTVESALGRGTTVRILLPAATSPAVAAASPARADGPDTARAGLEGEPTTAGASAAGDGATVPVGGHADGRRRSSVVLVVDDDARVRQLAAEALWRDGWSVVVASGAEEALDAAATAADRLALLVTDLVMPGTDGIELAAQLVLSQPDLPVLYVTGGGPRRLPDGVAVLAKPFTAAQLVDQVRRLASVDR